MHNNISDGAEKPEGDEKVALSTAKPSASGDTLPLPAMYCTRPDLYTMGTAEKEHAEPEREIPFMLVPGVTTDEKLAAIGIYRSGVPDDEQVRNVSGRKSLRSAYYTVLFLIDFRPDTCTAFCICRYHSRRGSGPCDRC